MGELLNSVPDWAIWTGLGLLALMGIAGASALIDDWFGDVRPRGGRR